MPTLKYPVVIWKDASGCFTISTLLGFEATAADHDRKKATTQLKKYLTQRHRREWSDFNPVLESPQIGTVDVPIRPETKMGEGYTFPSEQPIQLPVSFVWGHRFDGAVYCVLPVLETSFYCRSEKLIEPLVIDRAKSALQSITQTDLARLFGPSEISVDTIFVKVAPRESTGHGNRFPILETVAIALGSRESKRTFSRAWRRDADVNRLATGLADMRNNIMLLGPSGVGKTTLLVNAIRALERQEREAGKEKKDADEFADTDTVKPAERFWYTSADRLIAGMQYLGQWEERAEEVISELQDVSGVLCIENLQQLVRLGGREATESIAAFLAPFLENRELKVIVEATQDELQSCQRLLPGFDSLFRIHRVAPLESDQARLVLIDIAEQFQKSHKIEFELEAAELCYQLFRRFMPYSVFPGRCVPFWKGMLEQLRREAGQSLSRDRVIRKFIQLTGLPETLVRDEYSLEPKEVRQYFESRIIGQPAACQRVTGIITTFKAGLNDPAKPVGVQLFCGPTGVGKTEMAKALADYMFGSGEAKDRLLRLDMSEYAGPAAAERLLTREDGRPSDFVQRVRDQPFLIVLLDEIEKASHVVFDVLMSLFDEGRLTDRWGRTTDFRSTIIIMTSNLGVQRTAPVGFANDDVGSFVRAIRKFFRPEFYNRFDAVVAFNPLDADSIRKIAALEIGRLEKRSGFASRNVTISSSEAVIDLVSRMGFHPRLGARPLQRTIEDLVVVPLARLIAESPNLRDTHLKLDVQDDRVTIA